MTASSLRGQLQGMDDYAFEHFVAELWERQGWDTTVSPRSKDAGIDIIAEQSDPVTIKQVIQAKRYTKGNKVSGPEIQQYSSLDRQVDGASSVVVVTSGQFTSEAGARASEHDVQLLDGADLEQIVDELDAYDLVEEFVGEPPIHKRDRRVGVATEKGTEAVSSLGGLLRYIARNPDEAAERAIGLFVLLVVLYAVGQAALILFDISLPL